MIQLPLLLYDDVAQEVERAIRRMCLDDVLMAQRRGWRLEYVRLSYGLTHYRLYKGKKLVGIVDVRSRSVLPRVQKNLAAYLAGLGFTPKNTRLIEAGSRTKLDAQKHRLQHLF